MPPGKLIRDFIARGVTENELTTPFPTEAAHAVINMGYSIASWYRPGGKLSPDDLVDRYAVLALGTVGARPSSPDSGTLMPEQHMQKEGSRQ